jgi:uncharacterized protein (TIGR03435 family)
MRLSFAVVTWLLLGVCRAQSPVIQTVKPAAGGERFEVADVHTSPHISQPVARGPFYADGRYEVRFATMLDLIRIGYNLDPARIFDGPSWLELDRYDVFAKAPTGSDAESCRRMLRALLADRFHLSAHEDTRPVAVWVLKAVSRRQMSEADDSGETGCRLDSSSQPSAAGSNDLHFSCRNTTMEVFAASLPSMAGAEQYLDPKLVLDQTGLQGGWNFGFHFTPRTPGRASMAGAGISLFDSLKGQLGLELYAANVPMPGIVVDSVNRKPSPNGPDIEKSLPKATGFEVASVKPSPPGTNSYRQEMRNGRISLSGVTVRTLIGLGWRIFNDDMLAGAPKWLSDDRFEIVAKAPAGIAFGDFSPERAGSQVNIDAIRPMIQALVRERFQLESHSEERPINVHLLTTSKAKLTRANAAARTRCVQHVAGANISNVNPALLGRVFNCQNMTMAEFAELLPSIAPVYVSSGVVDETGLEGGWDFTFGFSTAFDVRAGVGERSSDGGAAGSHSIPVAPEPNGAMSLFEALHAQLGLNLDQTEKRPAQVLVIDHIERKPIEN